jgi:protein-S-isoprenylcysteine O-methyltransferase Ste14
VPGLFIVDIPTAVLRTGAHIETGMLSYFAYLFWVLGTVIILWCFWDFLVKGRGIPAPIDPPKELVAKGLYEYVRNPMYVGVLVALVGQFLWFGYWFILAYTLFFFLALNAFVIIYEEPTLKKKFGAAYDDNLKRVPRWIPRVK